MTFYLIRHKATGQYMPQAKRNRGYSHWNPSTGGTMLYRLPIPRLVESEKRARAIIAQWNACPNAKMGFSMSYAGEEDYSVDIKPDGREKDDLEVVRVELVTTTGTERRKAAAWKGSD